MRLGLQFDKKEPPEEATEQNDHALSKYRLRTINADLLLAFIKKWLRPISHASINAKKNYRMQREFTSHLLRSTEVGSGWGKLPRLGELQQGTVGHISLLLCGESAFRQVFHSLSESFERPISHSLKRRC